MDFYDVLTQVMTLLQREGRISYRALKRQFDLDDDYLADLTEELIYAKRLAFDEGGKVLVWGEHVPPGATPVPPEPFAAPSSSPKEAASPRQEGTPLPPLHPPEAERRQLTVMFSDLVHSTQLSSHLDPEDWRAVIRAYQTAAAEVIQRYDGSIAQYLGDGLLVYFGYPLAHEDDAHRAIAAGLDLVAALPTLNSQLRAAYTIELAVRIGIHTGPVVVGDMGSGSRHEQLALGQTPNLAARLQGLAAANQVVISLPTRRLVGDAFEVTDLGFQVLKGIPDPVQVFGVSQARRVESRFEATRAATLTPFVGREEELALLLRRWQQAKDGEGQVVILGNFA